MGRKISDNKGQFTGKMPTGAENQRIADSTLFADGRQAITTVAISSSLTSKKPAELEEDATEEGISAHQDQGISDSVDMGGDEPLLLAQADIARVSGSGTGAAAAQSSSAYSAGPPPWLWVAGGLGALAAGGAIIAASSGSDSDAVSPPAPDTTAPVFTSSATGTVVEHAAVSTVIYDADATDATAITYSLKSTGDVALLDINPTTGEVTLKAPADYETKANYSFSVIASDGTNSAEQPVTVSVTDVHEHVVVEQTGAYIDLNGNGIQDSDDTTVTDFSVGGNADLTTNSVTIEFNNLPVTPINLSGFDMDDKIEIDVQAFIGNGHNALVLLGDAAAISLNQFTTYGNITASGIRQSYINTESVEYYALAKTTTPFTDFGVWLFNMSSLGFQSGFAGGATSAALATFTTLNITAARPLQFLVDFINLPETT